MSDDIIESAPEAAAPPKKKGKKLIMLVALLAVVGGGTAAGLYATGMIGGEEAHAAVDDRPKLVPKSEQKRVAAGEGGVINVNELKRGSIVDESGGNAITVGSLGELGTISTGAPVSVRSDSAVAVGRPRS